MKSPFFFRAQLDLGAKAYIGAYVTWPPPWARARVEA